MARKLSQVGIVILCGVLALISQAVPVQAADPPQPVIDVPTGTWSGVETVTVTDSSEGTKSIAVGISRTLGSGSETYVREANSTPGQPVTLEVPTWGWHGNVYVLVSFCQTVDDVCSGGYQYARTVTQDPADAVTADLEVPETPVLLPDEHAFVTLHNPGGGKLYLVPTDTGPITAGQRTEITWPDRNEPADLTAARCPPYFDPQFVDQITATKCELFDLHRSVVAFDGLRMSAYGLHNRVITDPAAPEGTSARMLVIGYRQVAQRVEYELDDASGTAVVGPVVWQLAYNPGPNYTPLRLDFDPTAAAGEQLPDGDYTLKFTSSVTKSGGLTKSVSSSVPLQLVKDPPPDELLPVYRVESAQRDVRGATPATVSVQGSNDPEILGTLHVTNSSGAEVWQHRVGPDCRGDVCQGDTSPGSPAWYEFAWPGRTTAGKALPVGRYHAAMTVVDHWGRTVKAVDVGSLYVTHLANRTKTVRYVPADSTWISNTIGRCSSAPSPGPHRWAGSVAILSLSRCASRAGTSDNAFRSFTLGLREPGQVRVLRYRVAAYGAPIRARQKGSIVYQASNGKWVRKGALSGRLGWHSARAQTLAARAGTGTSYLARVQGRASGGNKWDLKFWRVTWTYRAWVR